MLAKVAFNNIPRIINANITVAFTRAEFKCTSNISPAFIDQKPVMVTLVKIPVGYEIMR